MWHVSGERWGTQLGDLLRGSGGPRWPPVGPEHWGSVSASGSVHHSKAVHQSTESPGERMNERLNERLNEREGSSSHVIRQLLSAVWDLNSGEFFCFLFSNSFIRLGASKTLKAMVRFSGTGDWLAFSWRCWQAWSFRWPVVSLCSRGLLSKGPFLSCSRFVLILPEQFSSCYDSWRGLQGNKADRWNWIDQHFRR